MFIQKVKDEWKEKWYNKFGEFEKFDEIKKKNSFLEDLLLDIEKSLLKKMRLDKAANILISRDNLRRIFSNEIPKNWQDKTRNTIAYYVGYDGWDDFVNVFRDEITNQYELYAIQPVEENVTKPSAPTKKTFKIRNVSKWVGLFLLLLIMLFAVLFLYPLKKQNLSAKDIQRLSLTPLISSASYYKYPQMVKISYNLSGVSFKEASILVRNEVFQYPDRQIFNIYSESGDFYCSLQTPGIKIINLMVDGRLVKSFSYLVPTNDEWYACARVKSKNMPNQATNNSDRNFWYGVAQAQNTSQNWLTTPAFWKSYIQKDNRVYYPESFLHFPPSEIYRMESEENVFSRVAYLKAKDFPVNLGNLSIQFRAKRDYTSTEDCYSMALQLFDIDRSQFVFHVNLFCSTPNLFFEKQHLDPVTGENIGEFKNNPTYAPNSLIITNDSLNRIFEDHLWHDVNITLFSGKATIIIDSKKKEEVPFAVSYKDLKAIRFVFEGNGGLDDVILTDKLTNKIVFSDDFNNKNKRDKP